MKCLYLQLAKEKHYNDDIFTCFKVLERFFPAEEAHDSQG